MGVTIIDAYGRVIQYGLHKKGLRLDRLFLQGFMAGVYVGLGGHAASAAGGGYDPVASKGTPKLVYASIFPVAFIAIIFTGAELFTGNTMTMLICLFHRKVTLVDLLLNWLLTSLSNFLGTIFIAYFLTYLTGEFSDGTYHAFIVANAEKKVAYGWGSTFLRGIGANTFVCLAVWMTLGIDEAGSKIIALWFPIAAFCLAGYEHIIANFYTISVGMMHAANVTVYQCVVLNFIPTLLGNLVGGCGMVGLVYWYTCHDSWSQMERMSTVQLAREASIQLAPGAKLLAARQAGISAANKSPINTADSDYLLRPQSPKCGFTDLPSLHNESPTGCLDTPAAVDVAETKSVTQQKEMNEVSTTKS